MKKLVEGFSILIILTLYSPFAQANDGEIFTFGDDIVVHESESVRSAVSLGGNVSVLGSVEKDVISVGGSVFLGEHSTVGGNVVSVGGSITRQDGAQINGNVKVIDMTSLPSIASLVPGCFWPKLPRHFGVYSFLAFLALALVIVAIMPTTIGTVSSTAEHKLVGSILWGCLGLILIVPLAIGLLISILGIVLIPVEIVLVGCAFLLGYIAVIQLVGKKITIVLKHKNQPILIETIIGLVVFWILGLIPLLGWLIKSIAAFIGFGAIINTIIMRQRRVYR
ncbi:MAG: hypothetical protein JW920_07560 [Deltaproteobacteria bacterium]|nr:hypothetical protein [Deltaproteobacteria bacterium]